MPWRTDSLAGPSSFTQEAMAPRISSGHRLFVVTSSWLKQSLTR
jgi:hypothetical protein